MINSDPGLRRRSVSAISQALIWLCVVPLLAACGRKTATPQEIYRAPTAAVPLTPLVAIQPTPTVTPEVAIFPTATPECSNNLSYLEDISIPDGTVVNAGNEIDKQWRVKNSGTCNWDQSYHLRLSAGPDLGASSEQALYPARSGIEFPLRILFTAPAEPGTYRSAWQAVDPQGQLFGDPVFIEIVVQAPPSP